MDIESLRDYCLNKEDVEETLPFGPDVLVYKVGGKVFLLCVIDKEPFQFNVKCDPDLAIELREKFEGVLPGFHMNKKHWNTILPDASMSDRLLQQWIDHSYELIRTPLRKKKKKF
jgi:hypothetical protein